VFARYARKYLGAYGGLGTKISGIGATLHKNMPKKNATKSRIIWFALGAEGELFGRLVARGLPGRSSVVATTKTTNKLEQMQKKLTFSNKMRFRVRRSRALRLVYCKECRAEGPVF
jgi:hypothetical protein